MEAVKNFDPYRGVRFPSYAVWWIRAYIIRYVMNNWRMVKLGTTQAQRKLFFNLQKEKERLEREGIAPEPQADRAAARREGVAKSSRWSSGSASRDLSVDAPLDEGEDGTLLDVLPAAPPDCRGPVADAEFRQQVGEKIREFGATLKDKERVIFERATAGARSRLTLQEIGDEYGISRERVRQIEERLKKRLKAYLEGRDQGSARQPIRPRLTRRAAGLSRAEAFGAGSLAMVEVDGYSRARMTDR